MSLCFRSLINWKVNLWALWGGGGVRRSRYGPVFCCIFHIISWHHKHPVSQQWYSYKSCQSYNRRESYNFVFRHVCLVLEFRATTLDRLRPFLISDPELKFLIWTQGEIGPCGKRASPVDRTHVKRPLDAFPKSYSRHAGKKRDSDSLITGKAQEILLVKWMI